MKDNGKVTTILWVLLLSICLTSCNQEPTNPVAATILIMPEPIVEHTATLTRTSTSTRKPTTTVIPSRTNRPTVMDTPLPTYAEQPTSTSAPVITPTLYLPTAPPINLKGMARVDGVVNEVPCTTTLMATEDLNASLLLYERETENIYIYSLPEKRCLELKGAYIDLTFASLDNKQVIFENNEEIIYLYDAGIDKTYRTKIDEDRYNLQGWINENTVALEEVMGEQGFLLDTYNLNTQNVTRLKPNAPGMWYLDYIPFSNGTLIIPDPTLRYIAYRQIDQNFIGKLTIWDNQTERVVVEYKEYDAYLREPKWSPDGEKLGAFTFFRRFAQLDLRGGIQATKKLVDYYNEGNTVVYSWSWSPDSKKIALWLMKRVAITLMERRFVESRLLVIDLTTGFETDYGELGSIAHGLAYPEYTPAPIWSADGKYLLIENQPLPEGSELVVIDVETKVQRVIGKNVYPIGWLAAGGEN